MLSSVLNIKTAKEIVWPSNEKNRCVSMSQSPSMILLRLAICLLWASILSLLRLSMVITVILISKTECATSLQREDNDSPNLNAAPSIYWTVQTDVRVH